MDASLPQRDRVIDLYAELAQAVRSSPLHITNCNLTGSFPVEFNKGIWQPQEGVKRATIIPVFTEAHVCPHRHERAVDIAGHLLPLIDLVAWDGRNLALRVDAVCALGEWNLSRHYNSSYLHIYSDPIKWLSEGQNGVVIIDWQICAHHLIEWPSIVADNLALGFKIKESIEKERERRTPKMPTILVNNGDKNENSSCS